MLIDASAVLALINDEPFDVDLDIIVPEGNILSVAFAEVVGKLSAKGDDEQAIRLVLDALNMHVIPLDEKTAFAAGVLRTLDKSLSLVDRCYLAYAAETGVPLLTGDRAWADYAESLSIEVQLIR